MNRAVSEQEHTVGHFEGQGDVMGDDHTRGVEFILQHLDESRDDITSDGVEPCSRFVVQ